MSSDNRLTERHTLRLNGQVSIGARSRVLRRRRIEEIDVEVTNLSVSGASLVGAIESPLGALADGAMLELLFGGQRGVVRVCHIEWVDERVVLGVEFAHLSPELRTLIFALIEVFRDQDHALRTAWTSAH